MERKIIISEQPKCKTCGKLLLEWNAWADEHEHIECIAERISTSLIEIVKKQLGEIERTQLNIQKDCSCNGAVGKGF